MAIENFQTVKAHDPDSRYGLPEEGENKAVHPMDAEQSRTKHSKLMSWYLRERDIQAENRREMALDEDFYDGLQWSEEDAIVMRQRGQAPLTFNLIKPTIDWLIGTERRTRIDFKVLPREKDDVKPAEHKTSLLKYLNDTNKAQFARSLAFADSTKAGVGWLEDTINTDPTGERLRSGYESWRNIIYDSNSVDRDINKDARYLFRTKWLDLDVAQMYFPDRKDILHQAATSVGVYSQEQDEDLWYLGQHLRRANVADDRPIISTWSTSVYATLWNQRERVKLIECWYKEPIAVRMCVGGVYSGMETDDGNERMVNALACGDTELYEGVAMRMHVSICTEQHMLVSAKSPFRHNRFPLTPIWCYRRKRDNAPYGVIRNLRDPQEDYNKRSSKALFLLSTNRVIGDEGAVDDVEELREEAARPDAVILKKKGYELKFDVQDELVQGHVMLMEARKDQIREIGGVNSENLGLQTNAQSGRAILARQEQGSTVTAEPFDNLRWALQIAGEIQLSLVEQYYTEAKVFRILGKKGGAEYLSINTQGENGEITDDITARQSDFVIDEQDFRANLRIAMFETLAELVGKLPPEMAMQLLDLVVDIADVPIQYKEEVIKRIRKINGHEDPVDEADLTPEQIAERDDKKKAEVEAMAMQNQLIGAELKDILSKIDERLAKVENLKAATAKTRIETQGVAVDTAAIAVSAPKLMPVADELLNSAGHVDVNAVAPAVAIPPGQISAPP